MSASVLTTKLYIPPARINLVPRPRLIEQLSIGLRGPLTLISAPAGYGKTSLVGEWRASAAGCSYPLAWLSLDPDDNELVRFLTYLVTAIGTVKPDFGEITLVSLQAPQLSPPQAILTNLINELSVIEGPFALVLDDYQVITTQPIHDTLAFLLDHLPPQMHLVILSRADPPLPLARLRARNQMTEIRATDLRFTHAETEYFLKDIMGLTLAAEDMDTLEQRTEGWVAGLQLAALSLHGQEDPTHFIATFGGGSYYIVDYLVEEVLDRQSESLRKFLLQTSILDRLTGPLCEAVTGQAGGQATLEQLERSNLFVSLLGGECCWYRYHPLFADVMQNLLRQKYPSRLSDLNIRAAEWFEQNGFMSEAIGHAFVAEDRDLAARLIEQNSWPMIMRGELVPLINWGKAVGDAACKRPWLCIYQAWAHALAGQLEAVETCLQEAEGCLESIPLTGPRSRKAGKGYIAAIRAHLALFRDDAPHAIQLCQQAFNNLEETDLTMRSAVAFLLGVARLVSGDLENVIPAWSEAVRLGKASGSLLTATSAMDGITYLAMVKGELHKISSLCQEMVELSKTSRGQPLPLVSYAYARLAFLYYEWNDLAAAQDYAEKGAELSRLLARPNYIVQSHTVLARLYLAQHKLSSALELLSEAEQVAGQYALTLFADSLLAEMKMRLWAAKRDFQACERLAKERDIQVGKTFNHNRESEYLMLARVYLAQGKHQQALALQEQTLHKFESYEWQGRVIETLVLQAMILLAMDNPSQALDALAKALFLAEPEGYVRVFLDEGLPMAELLRRAGSKGIAPRYIIKLLAEFDKVSSVPKAARQPLIEPLSDRELEVVQLLSDGLSNQEIAEKLFISLGTVKAHTSSIYRKLDVRSRIQAITRSKDLGLL